MMDAFKLGADLGKSALVIVDLQKGECYGDELIGKMIDKLEAFVGRVREIGLPVVWIKTDYGYDSDALSFYRICPGQDAVFSKQVWNAFSNHGLDEYFQSNGINTLIVTGVYARFCVNATVDGATALGYDVIVPADLVSDGEESDYFKRALAGNKQDLNFAVVSSDDIIGFLDFASNGFNYVV